MANALDTLKNLLTELNTSDDYQATIKKFAPEVLSHLRPAIADGSVRKVAGLVAGEYNKTTAREIDQLAKEVNYFAQQAAKNDIASYGNPVGPTALEVAQRLISRTLKMTEEQEVTFTRAFEAVYTPAVKRFSDAAGGGKTPEDIVHEKHKVLGKMTAQEVADILATGAPELSEREKIQAIVDLVSQSDEKKLTTLFNTVASKVGGYDIQELIVTGADFMVDVFEAAERGDFTAISDPLNAKAFADSLRKLLTATEEGLQAAGYTAPPDLLRMLSTPSQQFTALRNKGMAKQAEADIQQGIGKDGLKVNKPLRIKPRKKNPPAPGA
ncbi:MAG: hypothetical protein GC185_12680 [Alphaproteobacteria bacterium]|nr:hypothetical protein [Alphaproteobacteria bacterium]